MASEMFLYFTIIVKSGQTLLFAFLYQYKIIKLHNKIPLKTENFILGTGLIIKLSLKTTTKKLSFFKHFFICL